MMISEIYVIGLAQSVLSLDLVKLEHLPIPGHFPPIETYLSLFNCNALGPRFVLARIGKSFQVYLKSMLVGSRVAYTCYIK